MAQADKDNDKENETENEARGAANEAWSKNWLQPVLLLMLREWSSYGYELMEKMAAFGLAAMNPGTVYRTLRQMEKDGIIHSRWDTSTAGPARRIYSITDAGETYLKYWADSLDRYQKMMNTFFQMYTGQSNRPRTDKRERKDDDDS
ncbi:MAG: poly-beta-hydroxybutyrate-responsive repressor [Ktedonobacteraceae bacterium]